MFVKIPIAIVARPVTRASTAVTRQPTAPRPPRCTTAIIAEGRRSGLIVIRVAVGHQHKLGPVAGVLARAVYGPTGLLTKQRIWRNRTFVRYAGLACSRGCKSPRNESPRGLLHSARSLCVGADCVSLELKRTLLPVVTDND